MTILTVPNPILTIVSKPVVNLDKKTLQFIKELEDTLKNKKDPEGVGLSAPQVGKNIRIFSTYLEDGFKRPLKTYINPIITTTSKELTLGPKPKKPYLEGCLSIPAIYGPVWRYQWIEMEFTILNPTTLESSTTKKRFEGFEARVIQHEYDHLEGVLFTARALEQGLKLFQEVEGELVLLNN